MLKKLNWIRLTGLTTLMVLIKWMGLFLWWKSSFAILRLSFSSKLDCDSYIISSAKTRALKLGALVCSISFFLLTLLYISKNVPYGFAWNTVVNSGLVLQNATWNCLICYKNGYVGLLVLHFPPLLNTWIIIKM